MRVRALIVICASLLTTGCEQESLPPLVIDEVEVTAPRPGMGMSAGYLRITNNAKSPVSISRVASPQFGKVELHESTTVEGVARMRPIESLDIDSGSTLTLERGGKHLMLMQPVDDLDVVTLNFYANDTLLISVETRVAARQP